MWKLFPSFVNYFEKQERRAKAYREDMALLEEAAQKALANLTADAGTTLRSRRAFSNATEALSNEKLGMTGSSVCKLGHTKRQKYWRSYGFPEHGRRLLRPLLRLRIWLSDHHTIYRGLSNGNHLPCSEHDTRKTKYISRQFFTSYFSSQEFTELRYTRTYRYSHKLAFPGLCHHRSTCTPCTTTTTPVYRIFQTVWWTIYLRGCTMSRTHSVSVNTFRDWQSRVIPSCAF